MCDTAGQTPGTRRNGTDLQTAAEKAIQTLEASAPIVEPDEPVAPTSRPAIPPPPSETEPEALATELPEPEPITAPSVLPVVPDEPVAAAEAVEPVVDPAQTGEEEAEVDALLAGDETFGTLRPVATDADEPDYIVPVASFSGSPARSWVVRVGVAAFAIGVGLVAFGAAFSERSPAALGKGLHTPRISLATAPAPAVAEDEATESAVEPEIVAPDEDSAAPKKLKKGTPGFAGFGFEPKTKGKGARGRTSFERMPFGSIASREDEPMGVYPFLIREKTADEAPTGDSPLPPPPAPIPEAPAAVPAPAAP